MLRSKQRLKWVPYIALTAIILVCLAVLGLLGQTGGLFTAGASVRSASSFRDLPRGVSFEGASGPVFHAFNSAGYAFATRDGVRFIGANGEITQEYVFTLGNVHLYANQDHFIVYEPGGSDARVFSPSGMMYHRAFDGRILSASVNSSGSSAFVVRTTASYKTRLFDPSGAEPPAMRYIVHADENVFPVSAAISEDGRIAAVALLDVDGANVLSRLAFYYLNEQAQSHSEGLFARLQFDNEVAGRLMFFPDGSLAIFSDRTIRQISFLGDVVAETSVITLGNRISRLTRTGGGFAAALGEGFVGMDSDRAGTVISFDSALSERFRFNPDRNTTYIWANDNALVVGAGRSIYGLSRDGRVLWNYNATQDYSQVLMLENRDTILFAARSEARVMRRATGFSLQ
ncbi:MAG: DUF5711 family protein [Defluviitaleaceae bacterium]|nr:DUF5711 family protein [Defluviitaleaceae bacterium]